MEKNIEELDTYIDELKEVFPNRRTLILPALRFAQERFGCVSDDIIEKVACRIGVAPVKVLSTARFYHLFTEKSQARFRIEVCASISCSLLGSAHVYDYLKRRLDVIDGISSDGNFSLHKTGCLGSCGTAPSMLINNRLFENLTFEKIDRIIEDLQGGKDIDKILG